MVCSGSVKKSLVWIGISLCEEIAEDCMCIFFPVFSEPHSLSLNTKQILAAMYQVESIISLHPLPVCPRRSTTQRVRLREREELVRVPGPFNLGLLSGTKMLRHHTELEKNDIALTF